MQLSKRRNFTIMATILCLLLLQGLFFNTVLAKYVANPTFTENGYSYWDKSILEMTVTISGTTAQFVVSKNGGGLFTSNGTMYLQKDNYNSWVEPEYSARVIANQTSQVVLKGYLDNDYSTDYYARFEGDIVDEYGYHTYAWVGPIEIIYTPPQVPQVDRVIPNEGIINNPIEFSIYGSHLTSDMGFYVPQCEDVIELSGGTTTLRKFQCTPKYKPGIKQGLVKDKSDGNTLFNFDVTIKPEEKPNQIPEYISGQVEPDQAYSGDTLTFRSQWRDDDNDYIVDVKARYKQQGTSWNSQFISLDYIPGSNPPTFQKTIVIQGSEGKYDFQFQASDATEGFTVIHTTQWIDGGTFEIKAVPKIEVYKVEPLEGILDNQLVFSIYGKNLTPKMGFYIHECANVIEKSGGTSTLRKFQCTPQYSPGIKQGLVKDESEGNTLFIFNVTIKPEEKPNQMPEYISGQIEPDQAYSGDTLTFRSQWQDDDNDYIVDVKARYKQQGASWNSQFISLDYIPGSNPPKFEKTIAIQGSEGKYEFQFQASDAAEGDTVIHTTQWINGGTFEIKAVPKIEVYKVEPLEGFLDNPIVFSIYGKNLTPKMGFYIHECVNVIEKSGGSSTLRQFQCTPQYSAGLKNGIVKDKKGGDELFEFEINVKETEKPNQTPQYISGQITPKKGYSGDVFTFKTSWEDPDNNYIVNVKLRYKQIGTDWNSDHFFLSYIPNTTPPEYQTSVIISREPGIYGYQFQVSDAQDASGAVLSTTDWVDGGTFEIKPMPEPIRFPELSVTNANFENGDTIVIDGNNFTPQGQVNFHLTGPTGFNQIIKTLQATNTGTIHYEYTENPDQLFPGNYECSAQDLETNRWTSVKTIIRIEELPIDMGIQILYPTDQVSIIEAKPFTIKWNDKIFKHFNNPVYSDNLLRKCRYNFYYADENGDIWHFLNTSLDFLAYPNEIVSLQNRLTIPVGYSKIRIKIEDAYNDDRDMFTEPVPIRQLSGEISVEWLWDHSYPQPQDAKHPIGVAADGVSRIIMKLTNLTHKDIKKIKVELENVSSPDAVSSRLVGKVKKATLIDKYSEEANDAKDIYAIDTTPGKKEYYFWYVAPDDFASYPVHQSVYEKNRFVLPKFIVEYSNGMTQEIKDNKIQIVRPPLMLVHGLGGSPDTWSDFSYYNPYEEKPPYAQSGLDDKNGVIIPYHSDSGRFIVSKAIKLIPNAFFQDNVRILLADNQNESSFYSVIGKIRNSGYACNQVYYVCHSMGGSILRQAALNPKYISNHNYSFGYVNKAITLDTPHHGSEISDLYEVLVNNEVMNQFYHEPDIVQLVTEYSNYFKMSLYLDFNNPLPIIDVGIGYRISDISDALKDLRVNQGIQFTKPTSIPTHLICGDIENLDLPWYSAIFDPYSWGYKHLFEHIFDIFYAKYSPSFGVCSEAECIERDLLRDDLLVLKDISNSTERFIQFVDFLMNAYDIKKDGFILDSDLIVHVNSQLAGLERNAKNVSVFYNVDHCFSEAVTSNLYVGNQVNELLHTSTKTELFDNIPSRNISKRKIKKTEKTTSDLLIFPTSTHENAIQLIYPEQNANILLGSQLNIKVRILDLVDLEYIKVYFQNNTYMFTTFTDEILSVSIPIEESNIGNQQFRIFALYNYEDHTSTANIYSNVKVISDDSLQKIEIHPKLNKLYVGEVIFPEYRAIFDSFECTISYLNLEISISIADNSVISYSNFTNSFKALKEGKTYAEITYQNKKDIIYFDVYPIISDNSNILKPKPGNITFLQNKYSISETSGELCLWVYRENGSNNTVSIDYTTQADSAQEATDFSPISGTIEWIDGDDIPKSFIINIIDDQEYEFDETFDIILSNSTGGAILGNHSIMSITIQNDDAVIPSDENNKHWVIATGDKTQNNNYILNTIIGEPFVQEQIINNQYISNVGFVYLEQPSAIHLKIDNAEAKPGTKNIPVALIMDNQSYLNMPIASLECQIAVDRTRGIKLQDAITTERTQKFSISVMSNETTEQIISKIILYNATGHQISPGTAPILDLIFDVSLAALEEASSELSLNHCTVSDAQANLIPSYYSKSSLFKILSLIPCDLTGDDKINILDLQMMINVIFGKETRPPVIDRSDIILDGAVNILDLQCMINKIIGRDCRSTKRISRKSDINHISLPCLKLKPNQTGDFGLTLSNIDDISSGQIRLIYSKSSGFDISGIHLTERTKDFETTFVKDESDINTVSILVLFYSLNDTVISKGSGIILSFDYTTTDHAKGKSKLQFTQSILSDSYANALPVHIQNGWILIGEDDHLLEAITLLKILSDIHVHINFDPSENVKNKINLSDVILLLKNVSL